MSLTTKLKLLRCNTFFERKILVSGVFSDNLTFSFLLLQNMEKYAVFARVALDYLLVLLGTFITGSPFLHVHILRPYMVSRLHLIRLQKAFFLHVDTL